MTEMEMVRTLAELIALGTAIVVPILKLNSNIVKLTDAVNGLKEANGKLEESNTEEHKQLHERINHRKNWTIAWLTTSAVSVSSNINNFRRTST